jgi:hypothetical protein
LDLFGRPGSRTRVGCLHLHTARRAPGHAHELISSRVRTSVGSPPRSPPLRRRTVVVVAAVPQWQQLAAALLVHCTWATVRRRRVVVGFDCTATAFKHAWRSRGRHGSLCPCVRHGACRCRAESIADGRRRRPPRPGPAGRILLTFCHTGALLLKLARESAGQGYSVMA